MTGQADHGGPDPHLDLAGDVFGERDHGLGHLHELVEVLEGLADLHTGVQFSRYLAFRAGFSGKFRELGTPREIPSVDMSINSKHDFSFILIA